jgi:glycosyltransferase involved in cell wall biosynthesis
MLISFVILNYDGKEITERCMESLIRCITVYNYKTIVVDNESSDGSIEYLKNKFPSIKIIEEGYNKFSKISSNNCDNGSIDDSVEKIKVRADGNINIDLKVNFF